MGALKQKYFGIRGVMDFMGLIRDPQDTAKIFKLIGHLKSSKTPEWLDAMLAKVFQDPLMENAYQTKYWPEVPSYELLTAYPEGSFGRAYADFLDQWNLDKDLFPEPKLGDRSDYMTSRLYQAHDFWHVLTGYTPAVEDELALQAFGVAQYGQPLSALIVSAGLIHTLQTRPEKAELTLEKISEGFQRGRKARFLLTSDIFGRLREPLNEVRKDLNLD